MFLLFSYLSHRHFRLPMELHQTTSSILLHKALLQTAMLHIVVIPNRLLIRHLLDNSALRRLRRYINAILIILYHHLVMDRGLFAKRGPSPILKQKCPLPVMMSLHLHCLKGIAAVAIDCIFPTTDCWGLLILLVVYSV